MDVDPCRLDDQPPPTKYNGVEALLALTSGPLRSSLSKLSASSRAIPSDKDFHFYYNFDEFKLPVKDIVSRSESVLQRIGAAGDVLGKLTSFPEGDMDEGYDWAVGINDEILERFDSSVDEFERVRKREEDGVGRGRGLGMGNDEFQLVCGKKSKTLNQGEEVEMSGGEDFSQYGVKMAFKDKKTLGAKPRVPFHIPSIRRPQDEYKILVNNANQPFEHVWLERCEDGSRFVHPLEKLSVLDFVDKNLGVLKPTKPPSFESTPFKLIQEVKDLKELSAKLRGVDEFAVDLEHNQYRSFQGLTCLMQISTRTEDYIVDTLKLRVHVGPYLREVFKDPTKKKVMHGADRDIVWLQRDFGIYICNLFDTGQASRVLQLERNSLEYLLHHFCGVSANKEYQNADWRLRPLPEEMTRYAREDTHYLLYIYDLLKIELTKMPKNPEKADDPLLEVYKRSYDICMQFYEKELLTENSYLYIYGLIGSNFNAHQLAIVAGLCEWRDIVARAEDESTGYILPNKTLLEIAKQMPVTVGKLRRLVKSKHPYVERNIGAFLAIIFHAIQNASAFEPVAEQLKRGALDVVQEEIMPVEDASASASMEVEDSATSSDRTAITSIGDAIPNIEDKRSDFVKTQYDVYGQRSLPGNVGSQSNMTTGSFGYAPVYPNEIAAVPMSSRTEISQTTPVDSAKVSTTVQVSKKPSRAFGVLFGTGPGKKSEQIANDKKMMKLEQIKSSVNLPFHSFSGTSPQPEQLARGEQVKVFGVRHDEDPAQPCVVANSASEGIIMLEDDKITEEPANADEGIASADAEQESKQDENGSGTADFNEEVDGEDGPTSLSELAFSFRKCFQPRQPHKSQEPSALLNFKPFDYEVARKQIKFGKSSLAEAGEETREAPGRQAKKKGTSVTSSQERRIEESGGFQPGRRSQAFPVTGNRSATFKSA